MRVMPKILVLPEQTTTLMDAMDHQRLPLQLAAALHQFNVEEVSTGQSHYLAIEVIVGMHAPLCEASMTLEWSINHANTLVNYSNSSHSSFVAYRKQYWQSVEGVAHITYYSLPNVDGISKIIFLSGIPLRAGYPGSLQQHNVTRPN